MSHIQIAIGEEFFERLREDKCYYVDKTELIYQLKNYAPYIFLSRPRRFGKSMAAAMLAAYYSKGCNSENMFQNLKIAETPDFFKHSLCKSDSDNMQRKFERIIS